MSRNPSRLLTAVAMALFIAAPTVAQTVDTARAAPTISHCRGASAAPYDLQFIDMMSMHHEGGMKMARDAVGRAEHGKLRTLAQKIVNSQQKDSEKMRSWKSGWGGSSGGRSR